MKHVVTFCLVSSVLSLDHHLMEIQQLQVNANRSTHAQCISWLRNEGFTDSVMRHDWTAHSKMVLITITRWLFVTVAQSDVEWVLCCWVKSPSFCQYVFSLAFNVLVDAVKHWWFIFWCYLIEWHDTLRQRYDSIRQRADNHVFIKINIKSGNLW